MIKTFRDKNTEKIYSGERFKGISTDLAKKARRRLAILNRAIQLEDLYFPPSNQFHALSGYTPTRYAIAVINNGFLLSNGMKVMFMMLFSKITTERCLR